MNNLELCDSISYIGDVIGEAIENGATEEELLFIQDSQRAMRIAYFMLNDMVDAISEVE